MADTKSHHAPRHEHGRVAPVEGDGISYSGIVWFVVILTVTTLVCQGLMIVLFKALEYQAREANVVTAAAPLAPPPMNRPEVGGRVYPNMVAIGRPDGPTPALLVQEPANLETLRAHEHEVLTTYGWADKNTGAIRIPIDRAKDLIIQRGLPTRTADAPKDGAAKPMDVKVVKEVKK